MASHTRICRFQIGPVDIGSFSEICSGIDRLTDYGADTGELRMQCVIEFGYREYARSLDLLRILMATSSTRPGSAKGCPRPSVLFVAPVWHTMHVSFF